MPVPSAELFQGVLLYWFLLVCCFGGFFLVGFFFFIFAFSSMAFVLTIYFLSHLSYNKDYFLITKHISPYVESLFLSAASPPRGSPNLQTSGESAPSTVSGSGRATYLQMDLGQTSGSCLIIVREKACREYLSFQARSPGQDVATISKSLAELYKVAS